MHLRDWSLWVVLAATWLGLPSGRVQAEDGEKLSARLQAEGARSLATAARERGDAVRGAIVFPQQKLGCASCHAAGDPHRLGPDLTDAREMPSDEQLVEALLEPSKRIRKGFETVQVETVQGKILTGRIIASHSDRLVLREVSPPYKLITLPQQEVQRVAPGSKSAMPEGLADQLTDRQQFLDLVRYLIEIRGTASAGGGAGRSPGTLGAAAGKPLDLTLQGRVLADRFRCAACHRLPAATDPLEVTPAPDLRWLAGRVNPGYLERFLADPAHTKPGGAMPDLLGMAADATTVPNRAEIARELSSYLASLAPAGSQPQSPDDEAAGRGRDLFHSVGCVACHAPRDADERELPLDDSVPLATSVSKYRLDGLVAFLEDPLAARPAGHMPDMKLTHWEAVDLANYLLKTTAPPAEAAGQGDSPPSAGPPIDRQLGDRQLGERQLVERGRQRFGELGCGRCHADPASTGEPAQGERTASREAGSREAGGRATGGGRGSAHFARTELRNAAGGCLSGQPGRWPRYVLSSGEREALQSWIERVTPLTAAEQIAVTLSSFRCLACHQRDELGGIAPARLDYFQTDNPNLGPQGRLPPPLTRVGAKIRPQWLRQVLLGGRAIRPYVQTRMPKYHGEQLEQLVHLLQQVDRLPEVGFAPVDDRKEMRDAGHQLAGKDGLNCIACHNFRQKPAATMPAVDLTEMAERLHKEWFYLYLREPQRLSPGTVMPSFWPGGRAIRPDVLGGVPDHQIEALWQYLLEGREARPPRGLVNEPIELLATDEAVMLRRSYPGIGKRGIGVGYPRQVNLAFDAEQLRWGLIWKGKFADPAGVWRSQGHGMVRPLGSDLVQFPAGPELDDADDPWVVDEGRPPRHQFQGYTLDKLRRPTFRYRFDRVQVTDAALDVEAESGQVSLRRTLTFTTSQPREGLRFRVASGQQIEPLDGGVFLIGKLRVAIETPHRAVVLDGPDGQRLQVPLTLAPGPTRLVIHYTW